MSCCACGALAGAAESRLRSPANRVRRPAATTCARVKTTDPDVGNAEVPMLVWPQIAAGTQSCPATTSKTDGDDAICLEAVTEQSLLLAGCSSRRTTAAGKCIVADRGAGVGQLRSEPSDRFGSGLAARCSWKLTPAAHPRLASVLSRAPSPMCGSLRDKAAGRHHRGRRMLSHHVLGSRVRELGCAWA